MTGLARRLWHSPTVATWTLQAVAPFKLLVLTPLVVTRLDTVEIDVYYLFASANLLALLLSGRLADTFMKMIGFAHGGATSLLLVGGGPATLAGHGNDDPGDGGGDEPEGGGHQTGGGGHQDALPAAAGQPADPNWPLVIRAYRLLGLLLALCSLPALLFFLASAGFAVGQLTGWSAGGGRLWAAVTVASCIVPVELVLSRYEIALAGTGHLARAYRIKVLGNLVVAAGAAAALLVAADLLAMVSVQLALTVAARLLYLRALPERLRTAGPGIAWDARVWRWAWPPLWKGLLAMASGFGVQRTAGLFLASTGIAGFPASFLLAQTVLHTINLFALAPLHSQLPRYARMLAAGRRRAVVEDGRRRILAGAAILAAGVVATALAIPPLLALIGSNVPFVDGGTWLLLGALAVPHLLLTAPLTLYNATNDITGHVHSAIAGGLALGFFAVGAATESYAPFALGLFLPYLLVINVHGVRRCRALRDG